MDNGPRGKPPLYRQHPATKLRHEGGISLILPASRTRAAQMIGCLAGREVAVFCVQEEVLPHTAEGNTLAFLFLAIMAREAWCKRAWVGGEPSRAQQGTLASGRNATP